jgi:hypothetical protein
MECKGMAGGMVGLELFNHDGVEPVGSEIHHEGPERLHLLRDMVEWPVMKRLVISLWSEDFDEQGRNVGVVGEHGPTAPIDLHTPFTAVLNAIAYREEDGSSFRKRRTDRLKVCSRLAGKLLKPADTRGSRDEGLVLGHRSLYPVIRPVHELINIPATAGQTAT